MAHGKWHRHSPSSPSVNPAGEGAGDELAELLVCHLAAGIAKDLKVLRIEWEWERVCVVCGEVAVWV